MIFEIMVGAALFQFGSFVKAVYRERRPKYKLSELNHFDHGLVLPAVDDPSWEVQTGAVQCYNSTPCNRNKMKMGKIRACMDHGVLVDDMGLDQTWPHQKAKFIEYARAVRRSVCDRLIQESADMRWARLEAMSEDK